MKKPHRKGRVVVVTGASAGVGRAIVREFAKEGARIGLIARGRDGLEAAKDEIEALGGEAIVLPLDVSDWQNVDRAAAVVEDKFGPIDVWVNNAMVSVFSPVKEMKPEEFERVTEVTYLGYVWGTLAALQRMLPRNRGKIIQVSSALAYRSIPLQSAYCAAKHAIAGFTESLRCELIHDASRVSVTMVHLPAVNTPQFGWVLSRLPREPQPVPPIYQPEVPARAVVWASHHRRRAIDVGFSTIEAIASEKLSPAVGDWYLSRHGYDAQQTRVPVSPKRRSNLWEPLPGDPGAHGSFDAQARPFSRTLWVDLHRREIVLALLAAGFAFWRSSRRVGRSWVRLKDDMDKMAA